MTTTTAPAAPKVKHHRVLAFVAGVLVGLGAMLLVFVYGVLPVTWVPLALAALGGGVLAVVLVSVVPARGSG